MKIKINNIDSVSIRQRLRERGFKLTKQRERIINHFLKRDKHFSVEELYTELKRVVPGIGLSTIYRTLRLLVSVGIAKKRTFSDDIARFEHYREKKHHDHMICIGCGRIVEFENKRIEKLQKEAARKYNFYTISHKLELYGYCKKCKKNNFKEKQ